MKIDKAKAKRLYLTAEPWFKEELEKEFGKDFFNKESFEDNDRHMFS